MNWLWLAVAFLAGAAFVWYVAGRVVYAALKRSLIFDNALGRMPYDTLLRVRKQIDRELDKRRAPVEEVEA